MRVGKLNSSFTLMREILAPDGAGGSSRQWEVVGTLFGWMQVASEKSPSETTRQITHHIVVRYEADISVLTGMRLTLDGRGFLVRAVSNVGEEDRWLKLFVTEDQFLN